MTKTAYTLLALLPLLAAACSKDDESKKPAAPITTLQLTVTDNAGSPQAGVPVALYRTLADWEQEQNPVQAATTGNNGRALFSYLTDTAYYLSARKGNLSNWEGTTHLHGLQSGYANLAQLQLAASPSSLLSLAGGGKLWHLVIYKENNQNLSASPQAACLMDNRWRFNKGNRTGSFTLYEDSLVCLSGTPQIQNGTWQLLSNGQQLRLTAGQQAPVTYELEYLSETTLRLNRQAGGVTYAYVWQTN